VRRVLWRTGTPMLLSLLLGYATFIAGRNYGRAVVIRLATGPKGGTSEVCAALLAKAWQQDVPGITVKLVDVGGSIDSLERFGRRPATSALAIVDEPIDLAILTELPWPPKVDDPDLRSIARLYVNPLEVIATKASQLNRLGEVRDGHRIALAGRLTGSSRRVEVLLQHYRFISRPGIAKVSSETVDEVAQKLRTGAADIGFFGGALPLPAVEDQLLEGQDRYQFVEIEFAAAIAGRFPPLFEYTIPTAAYWANPPFPDRDILTVASHMTLVGAADLETRIGRHLTYELTASIYRNRGTFAAKLPAMQTLNENTSTKAPYYQLFAGADLFYQRREPFNWAPLSFALSFVGLVVSLVFSILGLRQRRGRISGESKASK
jgi:TRAP transporter TAXI family solute receptor